jgi:hypothetical protein
MSLDSSLVGRKLPSIPKQHTLVYGEFYSRYIARGEQDHRRVGHVPRCPDAFHWHIVRHRVAADARPPGLALGAVIVLGMTTRHKGLFPRLEIDEILQGWMRPAKY